MIPDEKAQFPKKGRLGRLKEQMYSRYRQPVTHPRRVLTNLENDAPSDWEHDADTSPTSSENTSSQNSMSRPQQHKRTSLPIVILLISIVLFVLAGGGATLFFLSGSNSITSGKIDVFVNGPRTLSGGDELALQVSVRNNNSVALEKADLVVTYPPGTREPSDMSTALVSKRYALGPIGPGGSKKGVVRGVFFGNNGDTKEMQLQVEYRIAHSSGTFVTPKTPYSFTLSSSALDISFVTNTEAVSGQPFEIATTITSNAKKTIRQVMVQFDRPFGFKVSNITFKSGNRVPQGMRTNTVWNIGDLAPGDSRTIIIKGVLDGQSGDKRVFRVRAGTSQVSGSKTIDNVLSDVEYPVTVKRPFLGMSLMYNGKTARQYIAQSGKVIPMTLTWRNNLSVALDNMVIVAVLGGSGVDQYKIKANKGFYRSTNSSIIWDKSTTKGEFAHVPAGSTGTLALYVTPRVAQQMKGTKEPVITFELHAQGQRLSETNVPDTLTSVLKDTVKIASDVTFDASGLYTANPLGSVGPLPPKVNNKTVYGILWEVTNSTSALQNAVVTAELPPYARWEGVTSPAEEKIVYNPNDRTVTWYLDTILSHTGNGVIPPRRVIFNVGLVPSTTQVGKAPDLLQNQVLRGTDAFTKASVVRTIPAVTTGLQEAGFNDFYRQVVK